MIYININNTPELFPIGTVAVVCAPTQEEAAVILQNALKGRGLEQGILAKDMVKFMAFPGNCVIVQDGDY